MNALYFWVTLSIVKYGDAILQSFYKGSRPSWASDNIENLYGCNKSFSSPCSACLATSYITITLYLYKYYEVGEHAVRFRSVMCTGYIIKMGLMALLIFLNLNMGFAQMYLGANSYNNVILGGLLGTLLAILFHFGLKIHFKHLQVYLSEAKNEKLRHLCCKKKKKNVQ